MKDIFDIIYRLLKWVSEITGFTYREINIIVYFIVIPSLICYLISRIYKKKYIIIGFLLLTFAALLIIPDFELFSDKLFDISVDFLNWFQNLGLDYIQASVLICVVIPILIISILFYLRKRR